MIVVSFGVYLLVPKVTTESLGNYFVVWEIGPVSPGVRNSYMVEFIVVNEM